MTTHIVDSPADTVDDRPLVTPPLPWRFRLLALAPGALSGAYLIWSASAVTPSGRRFTLFDDVMISMSYARTLARGGGLVWFEGAPRVEGITNPLWTFYLALLHVFGLEGSSAALVVSLTGLTAVLVTALAAGRIARSIRPGLNLAELATIVTVPLLFPLMYWSVRGMEVGLVTACTFTAAMLAARMRESGHDTDTSASRIPPLAAIGACLAIGLATRPDFAVAAVVIVAWLAWTAPSKRQRNQALLFLGCGSLALLAAITLARYAYYGELVPNTYTLKVTGVALTTRLARGIATDVKLLPTLAIAAVSTFFLWRTTAGHRRRVAVLVLATGVVVIAYSTYVGGDAWEALPNRYVAPALVAVAILGATAFSARVELTRFAREIVVLSITATTFLTLAGFWKLIGVPESTVTQLTAGIQGPVHLVPVIVAAVCSTWLLGQLVPRIPRQLVAIAVASFTALVAVTALPTVGLSSRILTAVLAVAAVVASTPLMKRVQPTQRNREIVTFVVASATFVLIFAMTLGLGVFIREASWNGGISAAGLRAGFLVPLMIVLVIVSIPLNPRRRTSVLIQLPLVLAILVATTSGGGWALWRTTDVLLVQLDNEAVILGEKLSAVTTGDATIAFSLAGATQYYADRNAADLLGKSDSHVARLPPRAPFLPGHNKWDYSWTIKSSQPDLVPQMWESTPAEDEMFVMNGYVRKCLAIEAHKYLWVLADSPSVLHSSPLLEDCE